MEGNLHRASRERARVQSQVGQLPQNLPFEGDGDALIDRAGGWLWAGYGFRSELDAHPLLAQFLGLDVLSLRLIDERFNHLDTCFARSVTAGCSMTRPPLIFSPTV
jgi:N-dimethylarginine dimethylaminohydrolase